MPDGPAAPPGARLGAYFDRVTRRRGGLGPPQVRLLGPGIDFAYGDQETPFHAASIGKLSTGVVVLQLVAEGALRLDDGIDEVLAPEVLEGLVAPRCAAPTVLQLLRHEGGIADFYEGDRGRRNGLVRVIAAQPQRRWTPGELLDFAREHQRPIGEPGRGFRYSDTGFVLLGLAIERLTGEAYHAAVTRRIVDRLGLERTFLPGRTAPRRGSETIAPCFLDAEDLSATNALSCGWAGGGVASTPRELIRFSEALHGGELVDGRALDTMRAVVHRVRPGIHYGAAMMQLRFDGFSPLLRGYPRPLGHLGSLATYLFHDPASGTHLAMNFHSRREIPRSIRAAIAVERELGRSVRRR